MERQNVDVGADQDLLTKDEARERLVTEIDRTRAKLAALKSPDDDAELTLLQRRLTAMESISSEYASYLQD
jgi:hypothetical protein